jgi:hypothetical protein
MKTSIADWEKILALLFHQETVKDIKKLTIKAIAEMA